MEYIRISKGLNDYKLYPNTFDVCKIIESAGNQDYYYGIYTYEQRHFDHYKKVRNLKGIKDITTGYLVWDFDHQENVSKARDDAKEVYSRLIQKGFDKDDIQTYFSGNRGFHLIIKLDKRLTRVEFENVVFGIGKGIETLDSTVKDQQRLLRMPFTKNPKSGLYCIPLTLEEFNNDPIDVIKEKAKECFVEQWDVYNQWRSVLVELPKSVAELKSLKPETQEKERQEVSFDDRLDIGRKPKWLSPTKFALQEGFFKEGERNTAFMILCATYKSHGFPKELAWRMLKGVAELQANRNGSEEYSPEALWKEIISCVYSESWLGGTYSETETNLLRETAERFNLEMDDLRDSKRLVTYKDMKERLLDLAKDFSNKRILTGFKQIDKNIVMIKGMCVGILAGPGGGKTSIVNSIVKNVASGGRKVLFESLDMSDVMMSLKPALGKLGGEYDFNTFMTDIEAGKNTEKLLKALEDSEAEQTNITYNYRTTGVEEIEDDILNFYNIHNQYPDLIVVDYFEKIRGPKGDPQGDAHYIIPRITDLAKAYDTCIIILFQPQKSAGDINEPLLSMRKIKGASVIEQDLRLIFTLWRPGANRDDASDDKYMQMAVVKNNLGPLERYKFHWDGPTGSIRDLTPDEEFQLEDLLERVEQEKADKKDREGFSNGTL